MAATPSTPAPIECVRAAGEIRATDPAGASVAVHTHGWEQADADDFCVPHDAVVAGETGGIVLPDGPVTVDAIGDATAPSPEVGTVGDGEFLLRVGTAVPVSVRFAGPATVDWEDGPTVAFESTRRVTVGFCSRVATPTATVTVPPTPRGLARAVTHASAALRTTGPERSLPWMRRHPPRVAIGEEDVPDAVAAATPDTGIRVELPATREAVCLAAPLAYYLGAEVSVTGRQRPVLRAPGVDATLAPLAERAPALLRRTFWLDALLREHPACSVPHEVALLDELGLDAPEARADDPAGRLRRYLTVPFERVADDLPEWHLAAYVDPTRERLAALPHLLDRLATIHPPETGPLPARELMERSLDDFYRGEAPAADVVEADLADAALHGWLAPETPIDAFTATPAAFEHRLAHLDADGRPAVVVVKNCSKMAGEESDAADSYEEHVDGSVTIRRDLTTAELTEVFAAGADLLHYVGHCETGGFQCADGFLAVENLPKNRVETFFLNACGSFREGRALVESGSVAGGVTYRKVLDGEAATVGTAFARLVATGFSVERAMRLARRRVMMGKDYAVFGDGTHSLSATASPLLAEVTPVTEGFRVQCRCVPDRTAGDTYTVSMTGEGSTGFCGGAVPARLDRPELVSFLDGTSMPVLFEGTLYWAADLADAL
jgi:hypothetical protein